MFRRKTEFIMGFPPIRYLLKKGFSGKFFSSSKAKENEFRKIIELFRNQLRAELSDDQIENLKKIEIDIDENAIIFLTPELNGPVTCYNLEKALTGFNYPGWLVHSTPPSAYERIVKSGYLSAPIEFIHEKRHI